MAFTVTINTADMRSFSTYMLALGSLLLLIFSGQALYAQGARLGVQGILKKSNGAALDDGNYSITFKLYNTEQGGTALWTETQTDVEVTSGIYTVALGSVTSLNLGFNEDYYLGVKVGSTPEMSPRARLTIAPYALSLKGNSNLLPSTGTVGGGTVTPNSNYLLHLNNASGAADERLEGTTGAGMTLKKGTTEHTVGYSSSDNKFRINSAGNNDINVVHTGTTRLSIVSGGVSVGGTGTFSQAVTVSAGTVQLGNFSISGSNLNNSNTWDIQKTGGNKLTFESDKVTLAGHLNMTTGSSKSYTTTFAWYNSGGNEGCVSGATPQNYSISCDGRVRATEFNAVSDKRIKKDIRTSNATADVDILRALQVRDYRHIDFLANGNDYKKGFIAQEVKEVYAEAVTSTPGFLPDVFQKAAGVQQSGNQLIISLTSKHGLQSGETIRLMLDDQQKDCQLAAVPDEQTLVIADWYEAAPQQVFVYGRQVNDFLQVDYDRIHTLNVSVTQELLRKKDAMERERAALRRENESLKASLDKIDVRMRNVEATLSH
jgi:hypothetical protein